LQRKQLVDTKLPLSREGLVQAPLLVEGLEVPLQQEELPLPWEGLVQAPLLAEGLKVPLQQEEQEELLVMAPLLLVRPLYNKHTNMTLNTFYFAQGNVVCSDQVAV
jgi:hypothetical protein